MLNDMFVFGLSALVGLPVHPHFSTCMLQSAGLLFLVVLFVFQICY